MTPADKWLVFYQESLDLKNELHPWVLSCMPECCGWHIYTSMYGVRKRLLYLAVLHNVSNPQQNLDNCGTKDTLARPVEYLALCRKIGAFLDRLPRSADRQLHCEIAHVRTGIIESHFFFARKCALLVAGILRHRGGYSRDIAALLAHAIYPQRTKGQ